MKTALQQLIEELSQIKSSNPFIQNTIDVIIDQAKEKLPIEKTQIKRSFIDGSKETATKYAVTKYFKDEYGN